MSRPVGPACKIEMWVKIRVFSLPTRCGSLISMKRPGMSWLLLAAAAAVFANAVLAQTIVVPATPKKFTTRGTGSGKGGLQTGASIQAKRAEPEKKIVRITLVGPRRAWTNIEGKKIEASLAAFSAPGEGEAGVVEVIRDGKIRLLLDNQNLPVEYPLANLSQDDQFYAKSAAQAVKAKETESDE